MFGTKVKMPPPRSYGKELNQTLDAQMGIAPRHFQAEATWQPKYAQLKVDTARKMLPGIMELQGDLQGRSSPFYDELVSQVGRELNYGGMLTGDQSRAVEQDARAAYSDRGLGRSNPAIFAELMGLQGARQQRLRERQGMALRLDGYGAQMGQQHYGNALNLLGVGGGARFNPESGYAQDLYNTNYNASVNKAITDANNKAALIGGIMELGGVAAAAGMEHM